VLIEWRTNGRNLHKALFPYSAFQKKYWWDVRRSEDQSLSEDHLKAMLQTSISLLREALLPLFEKEPDASHLNYLFTLDFYSYLLGLFEINDNSIEFTSPLQIFLQKELPFMKEPNRTAIWKLLEPTVDVILQEQLEENSDEEEEMEEDAMEEQHHHHHDDGKDEEHGHDHHDDLPADIPEGLRTALSHPFIFPPFQGLGLFPLEALTNHSCAPNTIVKFDKDNTCRLFALRDILPGEELTHSYIENELDLEQRKLDLRTYGFECTCIKCKTEAEGKPFVE